MRRMGSGFARAGSSADGLGRELSADRPEAVAEIAEA